MSNRPDEPSGEPPGESAEDAAWRTIVENYGDAPTFPAAPVTPPPPAPEPEHAELVERPDDHFVPPPAPPVSPPTGLRAAAWFGLFGVPTLVLVGLVLHLSLPSPLGLLLLCWFVGGFVYLVATMRQGGDDGWDDGAVL